MSWLEVEDVAYANAILIARCMDERGRIFPRGTEDSRTGELLPERRYGVWSLADAEANGYDMPRSASSAALSAAEETFDDEWWEVYEGCFESTEQLPVMGVNTSAELTTVDRGMHESFDLLLASPQFAEVRDEWVDCIEGHGLAPDPRARVLVPEIPSGTEQQIRVATLDVECKQSLSAVQRVADFEARIQAKYIDDHEAELVAYREDVDEVLDEAERIISSRGD